VDIAFSTNFLTLMASVFQRFLELLSAELGDDVAVIQLDKAHFT